MPTINEYIETNSNTVAQTFFENPKIRQELDNAGIEYFDENGYRGFAPVVEDYFTKKPTDAENIETFFKQNYWLVCQIRHRQVVDSADYFIRVQDKQGGNILVLPIIVGENSKPEGVAAALGNSMGIPMMLNDHLYTNWKNCMVINDEVKLKDIIQYLNSNISHSIGDSSKFCMAILQNKRPDFYRWIQENCDVEVKL